MRQGFSAALNAIVENLPAQRQTLLFSATQTKSVKDLARLSLRCPEYLAVHAEAEVPTPIKLQQAYIVCPLQDKTDILWSFIRSHLKVSTGQGSGGGGGFQNAPDEYCPSGSLWQAGRCSFKKGRSRDPAACPGALRGLTSPFQPLATLP